MREKLTREEFEKRLREKHGEIYTRYWTNYPNSIFYYDRNTDIDGTTPNIGIYTGEIAYSLEPA